MFSAAVLSLFTGRDPGSHLCWRTGKAFTGDSLTQAAIRSEPWRWPASAFGAGSGGGGRTGKPLLAPVEWGLQATSLPTPYPIFCWSSSHPSWGPHAIVHEITTMSQGWHFQRSFHQKGCQSNEPQKGETSASGFLDNEFEENRGLLPQSSSP